MDYLKAVDLFSGAGGVSEALKKYFKLELAVEYDPIHARSYKMNHGDEHLLIKDVTKVTKCELEDMEIDNIDLLVSTPPCQGFSRHTRRKIEDVNDTRNNLILETSRFARMLSPEYVFFENVPGIIYFKVFHKMVRELNNLKRDGTPRNKKYPSYNVNFEVVNVWEYGVPQKRKRLILVAEKIKEFPRKHCYVQTIGREYPKYYEEIEIEVIKEESQYLGEYLKEYRLEEIKAGQRSEKDPLHVSNNLSELNLERIKQTPKNGGSRHSWPDELVLDCHRGRKVGYGDVYGRMDFRDYAPTITGGCNSYSKGRFGHPVENRAISLREASLIQTFPSEYKFVGDLIAEPNYGSRNKIALQIGNAVPVKLAEAFIKAIYRKLY